MNFQLKVIIVILLILITTLLLNSVLSLASFEKLYVSSLVSTYELAGKNLQRKIGQALRFGKPLKQFKGMAQLLQDVVEQNPHISSLGIGTLQGDILYHLNPSLIGQRFAVPIPEFTEGQETFSQVVDGAYITVLPLVDRSKKPIGVIHLSFSRKVVYEKLKSMAAENLKVLWSMMLLASLGLIFFLTLLITRPVKRDILQLQKMLEWPADLARLDTRYQVHAETFPESLPPSSTASLDIAPDISARIRRFRPKYLDALQLRNEVHQLGWHLYKFVEHAYLMLQQTQHLTREQRNISTALTELHDGEQELSALIEDPVVPLDDSDIERLDTIIAHNRTFLNRVGPLLTPSGTFAPPPPGNIER